MKREQEVYFTRVTGKGYYYSYSNSLELGLTLFKIRVLGKDIKTIIDISHSVGQAERVVPIVNRFHIFMLG